MQLLSIEQKLSSVLKNITQVPTSYRNEILSLKSKQSTQKLDQIDYIKIETFYRVIQPAIYSLHWQKPNEEITYPVTGIIMDKSNQLGYFAVSVETATWIQSGGTRCIPIKSCISQSQIEQIIKMTHCAIIIESQNTKQNYKQFIKNYLKLANQQNNYPLLFIGKSSQVGLQYLNNYKIFINQKQQYGFSQIFISYDNNVLLNGLDLNLRLKIQNSKKISYPQFKFPINNVITGVQPKGYMRIKNQIIVTVMQYKQNNIYFLLNQPSKFQNSQNIQFFHCVISNFIDFVKSHKREINQKKIEKKLLAYHPIVYHSDRAFYKIG